MDWVFVVVVESESLVIEPAGGRGVGPKVRGGMKSQISSKDRL